MAGRLRAAAPRNRPGRGRPRILAAVLALGWPALAAALSGAATGMSKATFAVHAAVAWS